MAEAAAQHDVGRSARVPLVVAGVVSVGLLVLLLGSAWRGLDPIDESYVLRLVRHPRSSVAAGEVYLFPFLLHPLLALCGNDVGLFRLVGDLVVGAVAAGCFVEGARLVASRPQRLALAVGALTTAAAAQLVFLLEVRVLSYRSLALVGLLLAAWGVARVQRGRPLGGGALLGAGACLVFVAKPTSAVALLLVVVALGLWVRPPLRSLLTAAGALLAGSVLVLALARMTPGDAGRYLAGGLDVVRRTGAYPSVPQLLGLGPVDVVALLFAVPLVVVLGAWLVGRRHADDGATRVDAIVAPLLVLVGVGTAWLAVGLLSGSTNGYRTLGVGVVLLGLAVPVLRGWTGEQRRRVLPVLVLVALVPYLYAVGSNRELLTTTGQTAAAWVLLVGLLVVRSAGPVAGPGPQVVDDLPPVAPGLLVAACSCVVLMVAPLWWDGPRSAQVSRADRPVGILDGTLDVTPEAAAVLGPLHEVARRGGIDDRTPVVDLTGTQASVALALGGPPLGRAHFYTSWNGGVDSARAALGRVPCTERARAWLVVPASGTPSLAEAWSADWARVAEAYVVAHRYTGYAATAGTEHLVLRPGPGVAAALGCG
ncbi:hypothetical protein [Phycicoccus sonneratiae]|uniref:Glycosyltransferase RgtA/B/C/D-like domain-containing protein n=1 Tax=Phycicoccus sonneratiae TaxID=2807628 RepID=A0ABS2CM27_9MICO|nr:hypothetical protein [Phycicoccus sonneraticus]MBM6400938.1 hypothetical protein [Phycicoccus sonneraticus]